MQQYIDFFKKNKRLIERSCSPLLNERRGEALDAFLQLGFPGYKTEDYQQTDIAEWLSPDFGFYFDQSLFSDETGRIFRCNIPNLNSYHHFLINGFYREGRDNPVFPKDVFSGSLNQFAERYPVLFSRYYGQLAKSQKDGSVAFNTMFVQDGYVLYVPKNTVLENPVQVTNIANGKTDSLVNRRILIIFESGAQAKLLFCDHSAEEKVKFASTQVSEIYLGENAVLDFYELEETTSDTVRLSSNFISQSASSNLLINSICLSNGKTRNNYTVDLEGKHAETKLLGIAIADKQQRIDNYSLINHKVSHCHSDELFKYILDDESVGAFSGRIIVAQDAQKTIACQNNRNLCVSLNSRMFSKPQLEIYADDVKCSHGMTTGQLDENALFYLRSRGIPEEEARYLLKLAFAMDVLDGIRVESLNERLKRLIEKRFRGELITCQGCL
jgi:FeS assembly protein SufD